MSESFSLLITTGFLPQGFRDEMRLPWGPQTASLRQVDAAIGLSTA